MQSEFWYKKALLKIFQLIKSLFVISVPDQYKEEFSMVVNRINVIRVKVIAVIFIIFESALLILFLIKNQDNLFIYPNICYSGMYVLLLTAMIVYLLVFIKLGKDIRGNGKIILVAGISFTCFILYWCAGISLLDQLNYGQVIVYITALLAIAVVPFFSPITLFFIYSSGHLLFVALIPYFQQSGDVLYGNLVNSTIFLILSWVISRMRYVNCVEDFEYKKIIQEKSDELERVNKDLERANRILEKLSQTDSMTGISNRVVFDRAMITEWDRCRRHSIPLSLIMIDIDFFKEFNDNYGHQAGDDCLRQVAGLLNACTKRSSDVVARYGGDEFAVILPHMKQEEVVQFAEELRKEVLGLAIPHEYSSSSPYLTISLGVYTTIPSKESSIEEFIKAADQALYMAKKARNEVVGL